MTKQTISVGTLPNDGTGDPIRTAFGKVNSNFDELYLISASSVFNIMDPRYGASPDLADNKAAIQAAIDAAYDAGGGAVVIPNGVFNVQPPSGGNALTARDKVTLLGFGAGSVIRVANDMPDYGGVVGSTPGVSGFVVDGVTFDMNAENNECSVGSVGRMAIRIFGTGVDNVIRHCRFINIDAINTVTFNGLGLVGVTIEGCSFIDIQGEDHDYSAIYTRANDVVIANNRFASKRSGDTVPSAAVCAIETHGGRVSVTGNVITSLNRGMNITGIAIESDGSSVVGNTIYDAMSGIVLYSWHNPSGSGAALRDTVVAGNSVRLNPQIWTAVGYDSANDWCRGIAFDGADLDPTWNMSIIGNVITYDADLGTVSDGMANLLSAGITFYRSNTSTDRLLNISNNTVQGALCSGIVMASAGIVGVTIEGNTIENCGKAAASQSTALYKSGVLAIYAGSQVLIANNNIYDDDATPTMEYGIATQVTTGPHVAIRGNQCRVGTGKIEVNVFATSAVVDFDHVQKTGTFTLPGGDVNYGSKLVRTGTGIIYEQLTAGGGAGSTMTPCLTLPATTTDNGLARYNGTAGNVQTTGITIDDSNVILGGSIRSATITLADDAATSFALPNAGNSAIATVDVTGAAGGAAGSVYLRAVATIGSHLGWGGGSLAATTGALAGTTGTDGYVTLSCDAAGLAYVENRLGGSTTMGLVIKPR